MRCLWIPAALIAASTALLAQAPVKGAMLVKIVDSHDSTLWGAEVELPTLGVRFPVPDHGVLLIKDVASGSYILQARRVGYAQQTKMVKVVGADTARVTFTMPPATVALDTITVEGTRGQWFPDFERRRKIGQGQFFTAADIQQARAPRLSNFLSRARGLRLTVGNPDLLTNLRAMGRCGAVQIYLDGMPLSGDAVPTAIVAMQDPRVASGAPPAARPGATNPPTTGTTGSTGSGSGTGTGTGTGTGSTGTSNPPRVPTTAGIVMKSGATIPSSPMSSGGSTRFDINSIPLESIAAIEVYLDVAGIPPLYRGTHDECGIILLWTK